MSDLLEERPVVCPYCGTTVTIEIDLTAGDQSYVEDCYRCCSPITIEVSLDFDGSISEVRTKRDDE